MKIWILIALAACSYKDREQEQPPTHGAVVVPQPEVPSTTMAPIRAEIAGAQTPDAAAAPASSLPGIALPITLRQCDKPKLDDCGLDGVPKSAFVTIPVQCPIVTGVELRDASGSPLMRCGIVIRNGSAVSIVDTMMVCKNWNDAGQALPRTKALTATCTGNQLDVDLEAKDGPLTTKVRVSCRVADHGFTCAREPDLVAGGPAVARAFADVKRVIEAHQWRALLDLADPAHKKGQLGMGQDEPTYLAELMGLHFVGNSVGSGDDPITFDSLSTIEKIEPLEILRQGNGNYAVLGFATIKGGVRLKWVIEMVNRGGRYLLTGGVG